MVLWVVVAVSADGADKQQVQEGDLDKGSEEHALACSDVAGLFCKLRDRARAQWESQLWLIGG